MKLQNKKTDKKTNSWLADGLGSKGFLFGFPECSVQNLLKNQPPKKQKNRLMDCRGSWVGWVVFVVFLVFFVFLCFLFFLVFWVFWFFGYVTLKTLKHLV